MAYEGQPDYVVYGFLTNLWSPWVHLVNVDEWGEFLYALLNLAEAAASCSADEEARWAVDKIYAELLRAHEEGFWDDYIEDRHQKEILEAQANYDRVVEDWRAQAKGFNGTNNTIASDALESLLESLPAWVKPQESKRLLEIELATLTNENDAARQWITKRDGRINQIKAELGEDTK